ncbi:3-dehydroquinate synthase [candidate division KSB1 bacterium]|nr:3-dehydroquinate synthase [candidate division KSB1 bacterium]
MRTVNVDLGSRSYPIYIENGILNSLEDIFLKHQVPKKLAIITDTNVRMLYVDAIARRLKDRDYEVHVFDVPSGESSKNLQVMDHICEGLINARLDRTSPIVALGGGVVGDLAGFVAASFLRGVPFIQIPTTLLAQTDSSVGGKVAVNHALGKNLIGAFYQPQFVVIDPMVLKTLDIREVWAGLGEVIKYGLIESCELFTQLEDKIRTLVDLSDLEFMSSVIEQCCQIKADVVEQDEREGGLRKILNYGHTIGHALEATTKYKFFKHGEAVIWGMLAMSWLSAEQKMLSRDEFQRIEKLLKSVPVPNEWPLLSVDDIMSRVYIDKKNINSKLTVILLDKIGSSVIIENFDETLVQHAVEFVLDRVTINKAL